MLIDTHCHLDASEFDTDRDRVIGDAVAAGVAILVVPAVGASNFATVRRLAARHPAVRYALGIHPLLVDSSSDGDLLELRRHAEAAMGDCRFVGIGEIGLDHFVAGLDRERQQRFLIEQLKLARDLELPVILHVRRAQDHVLRELRRLRPRSGIAHAFNGSEQQARMFVDLGCALGFGGAMTFERALQIRRLAVALPPDAHVLETDSPDIPPAWLRRQRNSPVELPEIARAFATLRGESADQVLAATGANALRVLPRLGLAADPGAMGGAS